MLNLLFLQDKKMPDGQVCLITCFKLLKMKKIILVVFVLLYSAFIMAQPPADSTAYFKKIADQYRAMRMPEPSVQAMVELERQRLYPGIGKKPAVKQDAGSAKKVKEPEEEDDDAEAQKMMDDAIRKMGKDPAEVKKKMAEIPDSKLEEIPRLTTKKIAVTPASEAAIQASLVQMVPKADAALSAQKKAKAAKYLGKGRETGYIGVGLWINKEHDLALYIMLKACIEAPHDKLLLNNFATCLSMSGLPEKAIPILEYLNNKLPNNATVLNNLGQAWLSMGNIAKAKPLLEKAVVKDDTHPEANRSLAKIAVKEGNPSKAANYLEKSMAGGFDIQAFNQWKKLAPGRDPATFIRPNHKPHYKEVPITKRWTMPNIPSSVAEAQNGEQAIQQFFANLDATLSDMPAKINELRNAAFEQQSKQFLQMRQQSMNMRSLDDLQKYNNQFGSMFHPLKAQAQIMLQSIRSNDFSTSYSKRIEQVAENRKQRLAAMETSFKPTYDKIARLFKEIGTLEGGEKGDEAIKEEKLQKQICQLQREVQVLKLTQLAEINTQYMKMAESIFKQRLEEEMYWTALYAIPADPSGDLYNLYSDYLSELSKFKNLYPLPAPAQVYCEGTEDKHKPAIVHGQLQSWEDNHCPIDINYNFVLGEAKMNCHEIKLAAKIEIISIGWDRKIDPVTWETLEHSISIAGGIKEFETEFTDQIKGKVGIDGKATIKLDKDLVPTDFIMKAEAGAELKGPMGGKASADLGSVEVSVQGGLRGEGPVPDLVSKMFGN
jgi:tetratricopeptide (TPR) repeat protein